MWSGLNEWMQMHWLLLLLKIRCRQDWSTPWCNNAKVFLQQGVIYCSDLKFDAESNETIFRSIRAPCEKLGPKTACFVNSRTRMTHSVIIGASDRHATVTGRFLAPFATENVRTPITKMNITRDRRCANLAQAMQPPKRGPFEMFTQQIPNFIFAFERVRECT